MGNTNSNQSQLKHQHEENNKNDKNKDNNNRNRTLLKATPKYKNKDDNIPIAISVVNDSNDSTVNDRDRNITQNQKYLVTIPNDVIEGDLMVILVDNEEMIVSCREGKKSGDIIIISEDELIPQQYQFTVPEDFVIGEEFIVLLNNKELSYTWIATDKPGQLGVVSLPRKKKIRNPDDDIEKIKNIEKYGQMLYGYAKNGNITNIINLCDREDIRTFINYQDNKNGGSALSYSCQEGYKDIVSLLISHGAVINIVENDGLTPLYTAVQRGHIEIVSLLISEGADVNKRIRDGSSPLYGASYYGHSEIVDMLIDSGAHVNSQSLDGAAPLHVASQEGHIEIVRKLISSGAKVNLKDRNGVTPLGDATRKNHKEITEMLTKAEREMPDSKREIEDETVANKNGAIENRNRKHLEEALKRGKQKWNRSKIMIVGDGRAGKTALTRSMMGEPFEDTPSTAGINNITCDVKYASIEGECGEWVLYNKPEKELEASLARMIAAQQQQHQAIMETNDFVAVSTTPTVYEKVVRMVENENSLNGHTLSSHAVQPVKSIKVDVDGALVMKYLGEIKSSKLTLSVYDYGGQEVFNTIHHLFLTRLGVYIVVFNMEQMISNDKEVRQLCLDNISFWMNSIVVQTNTIDAIGIPIVLVGTHKDNVSSRDNHWAISKMLVERFACNKLAWSRIKKNETDDNFPICFFPVDNTIGNKDPIINKFMNLIVNNIETSVHVNEEKPLSWIKLFDHMTSLGQSYVFIDAVNTLAQRHGMEYSEVCSILELFHEMGELMWHNEDGLREIVILDAVKYFVQPVTRIICNHTKNPTEGRISHVQKIHLLCNQEHPDLYNRMVKEGIASELIFAFLLKDCEISAPVMIDMMIRFGLVIPLQEASETKYLIPALLPRLSNSSTDSMTVFKDRVDYKHSCFIMFSTSKIFQSQWLSGIDLSNKGFLPRGLFERLLCKTVNWCMQSVNGLSLDDVEILRNFAKLRYYNEIFTIRIIPEINCIEVKISAGNPCRIFGHIVANLETIIKECLKYLYFTILLAPCSGDASNIQSMQFVTMDKIETCLSNNLDLHSYDKSEVLLTHPELLEKYSIWFETSSDHFDETTIQDNGGSAEFLVLDEDTTATLPVEDNLMTALYVQYGHSTANNEINSTTDSTILLPTDYDESSVVV